MSKTFAIFDEDTGFLQYVGKGENPRDALLEYDKEVGISNPDNLPFDELAKEFHAYEISEQEAAALETWSEKNSASDDFPLKGREKISWRQ